MEVLNNNSAMLTNYEAYSLFTDIKNGRNGQKTPGNNQNLATITYSALNYLESTVCSKQSPEVICQFKQAIESFKLTKAEALQLLNLRPTTAVEIQLIVEESEERLTEEQIDDLIEVITTYLPGDDVEQTETAENK